MFRVLCINFNKLSLGDRKTVLRLLMDVISEGKLSKDVLKRYVHILSVCTKKKSKKKVG